jgi:hypothetical protein
LCGGIASRIEAMERGNRVWRYPIPPGADDDPARAAFVSEAQARLRAEPTAERRRQAAQKATEALRAKLRAAGIDPHAYYSMLAQRGNAARWRKQDAAPAASEAPGDGAQTEAAPPASEAAARGVQALTGQAEGQSVTGAQVPQAIATGVQATEAAEAAQSTPRRTGTLPVYLL